MPDTVAPAEKITSDQPWTVGFYGPFRVQTSLEDTDREIDIDDRQAVLNVEITMMDSEVLDLVAKITELRLDFDYTEHRDENGKITKERENILLHGKEQGPVYLVGGKSNNAGPDDPPPSLEMLPGESKTLEVKVQTGLFSVREEDKGSAEDPFNPGPASPGRKIVNVKIDYELAPKKIGDSRTNAEATMLLFIAED
jgi:hypothetical protein